MSHQSRYQYTSNALQYDLDDSGSADEAQALLSRFMRKTPQENGSRRNSLEPGSRTQYSIGKRVASHQPGCSISNSKPDLSSALLQHGNDRLSSPSNQSHNPDKEQSRKLSLRHRVESPRSRRSESSVDEVLIEPPNNNNVAVISPATRHASTSKRAIAPAARRSRRAITGPANYFAKIKLFDEEYSDDDNDVQRKTVNDNPPVKVERHDLSHIRSRSRTSSRLNHHYTISAGTWTQRIPSNSHCVDKLLRVRELGYSTKYQLHQRLSQSLRPSKSWKGASNDVIVLTWSPDGTRFAIGAAAQCDEHNMEYNRGNNLLLGDLTRGSLKELSDHWIPRPPRANNQPRSTTADPRLYMSVTAVQWFGDMLFTASYDNTVRLWDASDHHNAFCWKTLRHQSKVEVMARSNFNPNILATGTDSFGLWSIENEPTYTPLDIHFKRDIELTPSSLVWGTTTATEGMLVAGMSEKSPEFHGVPQHGYLAIWFAHESSMTPVQLSPSSQNIFDIKWHPSLPMFATGSSAPLQRAPGTARDTKSVVRVYEPLDSRRSKMEFDCPALDINDVTFCPSNSTYLSASCTDGATYVWDTRKPSHVLHKLQHGIPLNQIDENVPREQADVGVRVALWGDRVDQFYTGASDGVLNMWDILRSPEDVLVENTTRFTEEIMCGAFSGDKSNLLIGDAAGGIHVLSTGPFWDIDNHDMKLECAAEPPSYSDNGPDPESGIDIANELLSTGQLERHPIYGVGKGPHYNGPFARWARPKETPPHKIAVAPLFEELKVQQLDGVPVDERLGLDGRSREEIKARIRLSRIRNRRRCERKRKRSFINLVSDEEDSRHEIIDLTQDSDSEVSVSEVLEEDFWWPTNDKIDANLQYDD